jgi:cell pole-organizing protein PopZ
MPKAEEPSPPAPAVEAASTGLAQPATQPAPPQEPPVVAAPVQAAPAQAAPVEAPANPRPSLESLISNEATASIGQAFNVLSHTVLSRNARTLEDLVQDMLKPMLRAWLDDNLPPLVERLVRAEIERVARGRG